MTDSPNYTCYVGAQGWDHEGWVGSFYPDDLPADWRLTYYNNFFTCCYLSYTDWSQQPEATLVQWLDDTLPRFRFVLETPASLSEADRRRLAVLAPRTGQAAPASALQAFCLWLPDEPDWRALSAQIQQRAQTPGTPCYLISRTQVVADLQQALTLLEILGY
ncbi:DUF72 domain-containing protein [Sulfuriferula sp. GW1]|uniref:DUF72 domain-containing protein n=1 Tax=Sulfuriferula sp. GW1 TaxID=3345111 RepID=UPI0039AF53FC